MRKVFNLKKFREEKKLTQAQLATMLGVTQTDISRYEANSDGIPFKVILALSRTYNLTAISDFLNDEVLTVPPFAMPSLFEPVKKTRAIYLSKIYDNNDVSFEDYVSQFYITVERPIYQKMHKPLVIITGPNTSYMQDFISSFIGVETLVENPHFPVFFAHNDDKMLYSIEGIDDLKNEFPWLNEAVWYFKKPRHTPVFDISLGKSPVYASHIPPNQTEKDWESIYADFFLNEETQENATCAVVYADSDVLENCNLVFFTPEDVDKTVSDYLHNNADSTLSFIAGNSSFVTIRIDKQDYTYSFSDQTANQPFYAAFTKSVEKTIANIQKNAPSELKGYFTAFANIHRDSELEQTYSDADYNRIWSKIAQFKNDFSKIISDAKNETIKSFESVYTAITDPKYIETLLLSYGKETYHNPEDAEKQNCYPCNAADLQKTKEALYKIFEEKMDEAIAQGNRILLGEIENKASEYENEPILYGFFTNFLQGAEQGTKNSETENDMYEGWLGVFFQNFQFAFQGLDTLVEKYASDMLDTEKIFYNALEGITTFARGFSLSKARKISKALRNFQIYADFIRIANAHFESIEDFLGMFHSFSNMRTMLTALPKNEAEQQRQKELHQKERFIFQQLSQIDDKV